MSEKTVAVAEPPVAQPPLAATGGWWRTETAEPVRRNLGLVGVLVAILIVGSITKPNLFLDLNWLWNNELLVLTQASAIGVIAGGMTSGEETRCGRPSLD